MRDMGLYTAAHCNYSNLRISLTFCIISYQSHWWRQLSHIKDPYIESVQLDSAWEKYASIPESINLTSTISSSIFNDVNHTIPSLLVLIAFCHWGFQIKFCQWQNIFLKSSAYKWCFCILHARTPLPSPQISDKKKSFNSRGDVIILTVNMSWQPPRM